jgi:hypothetical protein
MQHGHSELGFMREGSGALRCFSSRCGLSEKNRCDERPRMRSVGPQRPSTSSSGKRCWVVLRHNRTMVLANPVRSSSRVALETFGLGRGGKPWPLSVQHQNLGSESEMHFGVLVGNKPGATWWIPVFVSPLNQPCWLCSTRHYQRDNTVGGC